MEMNIARVALLAATIFFTGCDNAPDAAKTPVAAPVVLEGKTMGTFWRVSVVGVDAKSASALQTKIQTQLDADDQLLSTYKNDSALMRFNQSKSLSPGLSTRPWRTLLPPRCALGKKRRGRWTSPSGRW